jgi:hypothetical protein
MGIAQSKLILEFSSGSIMREFLCVPLILRVSIETT